MLLSERVILQVVVRSIVSIWQSLVKVSLHLIALIRLLFLLKNHLELVALQIYFSAKWKCFCIPYV